MARKRKGEGQTVLVTGASMGIGVDLAECFAKDGYDLILTARSEAALHDVAAKLAGAHKVKAVPIAIDLGMPGNGEKGPTLEIFNYSRLSEGPAPAVNRPGFGHIAFAVDSVADARAEVLAAGGQPVGEIVTLTTAVGRQVTWCYVTDPEGNILELQSWS